MSSINDIGSGPIAVLGGTGALGAALARRLSAAGREVWIGSRDPDKARAAAAEYGATARGGSLAEAAAHGDIIFLAVPYAAHGETLSQVREAAQGKIVVDTTVPLRPPKVGTVQLPPAGCAALEAAQILGDGVRVVSALQTIGAEKLASGKAIDADVLVAGDDADAVEVVRTILGQLGLRSWHVGPLANSAAAEALTSVLIQINRRYKVAQAGIRITGQPKEASDGPRALSVTPVAGLPLFSDGDDLVGIIADALVASGQALQDGDVVVVAQKIVSKAEGRTVALAAVTPGEEAAAAAAVAQKDPQVVELVLRDSQELMRVVPGVIISRHRTGHVLANAGVDASNVESRDAPSVLLWPQDPDLSARSLREGLEARFGVRLAVIVSDSMGRAWRLGTVGTAIGVAGLSPLRDRRGETDLFGRELQATVIGVADEIAAAASLVIGEGAEGTPVAVVRGAVYDPDSDDKGIGELLRPLDEDLFR
jgi:coenzyme F420-0:L-glutamate ligase/NADPH-dependent F420 reductase